MPGADPRRPTSVAEYEAQRPAWVRAAQHIVRPPGGLLLVKYIDDQGKPRVDRREHAASMEKPEGYMEWAERIPGTGGSTCRVWMSPAYADVLKARKEKRRATIKAKAVAQEKGVRTEYRKCGKPNCRCARGELHGPYRYRLYREGTKVRRKYLGMG